MSQRAPAVSHSAVSQPAVNQPAVNQPAVNQPAVNHRTSDPFVPFDPIPASTARPSSAPVSLKVVPRGESTPAFSPLQTSGAPHVHGAGGNAGKPVVTLQREGDRVTGIRVECGCGQVIELACSY
jgi:hypothetical protein